MATLTPISAPMKPVRRPWNTLDRLTHSRTGLFALTALLLAAVVWATQVHSDALTLVGKDTVPNIIAAQKIKTALADMDADAVDDLLNPGSSHASGLFDKRLVDVSDSLVEAAKKATTFEGEQESIKTIDTVTVLYERLIQQSRDLQDAAQQASEPQKSELTDMSTRYYRAAALVMDGTLLPAADALDKANDDELSKQFESRSNYALFARLLMFVIGIGVLIALGMTQLYLSRHMQRTLNPALLAATCIAFLLTVFAYSAMAREQSDLRAAKTDAFDSIHALLQARANAYSANADESRFLLDPKHAAEYQHGFDVKSATLLRTALTHRQLISQLNSGGKVSGFSGLLADEVSNTFAGERDAAVDNIDKYEQYLKIDGEIRALEASGNHTDAIAKDVGDQSPEQSDYAFNEFDNSLGHTLDINQVAYDRSIQSGTDAIAKLDWMAAISALVMAVLIFFGFAPRLREYQ